MPSQTLHILIIASGPGIALSTALHFASQSFTHITLISRTQSNLTKTATAISIAHPACTVSTHACDVSDTSSLIEKLNTITITSGYPNVILFNAANVSPSPDLLSPDASSSTGLTATAARLTSDIATTTTALYIVASTLLPHMLSLALPKPTLLITSGHIHHTPFPPFWSLSASKAAQFNLAGSLAMVYGPLGVHVGMVVVNGLVGKEGEMSPGSIAEELWRVYEKGLLKVRQGEMSVGEVGRVEEFLRMVGALKE